MRGYSLYCQLGPNGSLCIESKIISKQVPPRDLILGSAGDAVRFERKAGTHSKSLVRKITCLRRLVPSEQNSDPPLCKRTVPLVSKLLFLRSGESGHNNNNKRIMGKERFTQTGKNNESPGCLLRRFAAVSIRKHTHSFSFLQNVTLLRSNLQEQAEWGKLHSRPPDST